MAFAHFDRFVRRPEFLELGIFKDNSMVAGFTLSDEPDLKLSYSLKIQTIIRVVLHFKEI